MMKVNRCSGKDGCGAFPAFEHGCDDCGSFMQLVCNCGRRSNRVWLGYGNVSLNDLAAYDWNTRNSGWVLCERELPAEIISRKLVVVEAYDERLAEPAILRGWGYYKHKHIDERSCPEKNAWHIKLETGQDAIIKKGGDSKYKVILWMDEPDLPDEY